MDTWDAITSRRQVRSYTDEPIPEETLHKILEAGRLSPSGKNVQPWDFVVVTDKEQLAAMSQTWQGASWVADTAATIAMVLPDDVEDDRHRLMQRFDLGQAALQIAVVAADLGVGSGLASCVDQDAARATLGVPGNKYVALQLGLGYPADRPLQPIKNFDRRDFDDVVHFGGW